MKINKDVSGVWYGDIYAAGIIPQMLRDGAPLTALEQLDQGYAHGGGWQEFDGFDVTDNGDSVTLRYPGDPPYHSVARVTINGSRVFVLPYAWVCVITQGGVPHVARMD